jgi:hypothetical protein
MDALCRRGLRPRALFLFEIMRGHTASTVQKRMRNFKLRQYRLATQKGGPNDSVEGMKF